MANKTIVYGDIISSEQRRQIEKSHSASRDLVCWYGDTRLFDTGGSATLVFVDLDNPVFSSADFLLSVATAGENVKVVGKADHADLDETLRVSKLGVSELLTAEQCLERLDGFLNELENRQGGSRARASRFGIAALRGESRQMSEIRQTMALLSDVDFPSALILGDTGTGKSLVCKILHNTGVRSNHNLVEVNCSAIPDELFESELFGHAKGAFTGAKTEKVGLFEFAQKGTLFLDEVGNLSASAQGKLLKILEDKKLRRVGDVGERDVDVRVVAATNLNLEKAIEDGRFRQDLYFRLNLLTIEIPPLRERPQDIPEIVEYYLNFYSTIYGKPDLTIIRTAVDEMQQYSWPGNVRELCNIVERAVLLAKTDTIELNDVKAALSKGRISASDRRQIVLEIPPQGLSLQEIEQNVVKQVLNVCGWNKSEAAKFLKISRPRLRRILEREGVEQNRRSD
ncbi:MAG: sigma-54 dependent transcriptional regulator [candidate division Zixibacteria bacterium]|nr:sigma-54 dependent transcriptional regulator [candidate division Zixibacteria bacterium]